MAQLSPLLTYALIMAWLGSSLLGPYATAHGQTAPQPTADNQLPTTTAQGKPGTDGQTKPYGGFRLHAPEVDGELRIRGLLQADTLILVDNAQPNQNSRFEIRRARLALSGTVGEFFGFRVEPQFTPGNVILLDGYADAKLLGPQLTLRIGKMKTPLGLEMLQPVTSLLLPERGLTTSLVPTRDIGLQFVGETADGLLAYELGVFGGAPDGTTPEGNVDSHVDLAGRVFVQPFATSAFSALQRLGLGLAMSWGLEHGSDDDSGLGAYRTGTRVTFARFVEGAEAAGQRRRLNPQCWWYVGPFGLLGEYVYSEQRTRLPNGASARLGNQALTVAASFVLTQEQASFDGVRASRPWGALELAVRYGMLQLDDRAFTAGFVAQGAPQSAQAWGLALNYWANALVRAQLAFEQTLFTAGEGTAFASENALFGRVQVGL